jgi:hypothetical protein
MKHFNLLIIKQIENLTEVACNFNHFSQMTE